MVSGDNKSGEIAVGGSSGQKVVIPARIYREIDSHDFFGLLIAGNAEEKKEAMDCLFEITSDQINAVNEFLGYSGSTPQRIRLIIDAIESFEGGKELLKKLRGMGANL